MKRELDGDGTDDIIDHLDLHDHVKHWTFGKVFSRATFKQDVLLKELKQAFDDMKSEGVELILFQAGADVHVLDPLGGWMESDEMRQRDRFVFQTCRDLKLPIAITLAGGYQRTTDGMIDAVLLLHRVTIEEALEVFGKSFEPTKRRIRIRDDTKESIGQRLLKLIASFHSASVCASSSREKTSLIRIT